jgi:hypothetical protein
VVDVEGAVLSDPQLPVTVLSSGGPPFNLRGALLCGGRDCLSVTETSTPTRSFRSCVLMRTTVLHTVLMLMFTFISGSVMNMFVVVVC